MKMMKESIMMNLKMLVDNLEGISLIRILRKINYQAYITTFYGVLSHIL